MTLSIHRRATLWGDRTAVVDDDGTAVSYAALADRAERRAAQLIALGVSRGDAVAILSRNRIEHLELCVACRRLGATLAPISHRLGEPAVTALGERIDPAVVVHEERFAALAGAVAGRGATDLTIDEFRASEPTPAEREAVPLDSGPAEPDAVDESPLLYLHTGGTTGVPKVVVISHRQVEWNAITEIAAWGLGEDDVVPALLPLFHVGGWLLLTLPTLYVGGRVLIHREFDPGRALRAIENHGVTRVFGVAAIFQAMAAHEDFDATDCSTVKWFMSGGGPTPDAVIDAYRERGQRFVQGYGLTEGGPNDLYFPPERADEAKATTSVGRPFPDVEARLVDPETGAVLGGAIDARGEDAGSRADGTVQGELELRGPVTARRYLETTDGTFEGEWVSTGDIAVRDAEGDYAITGRTDNMFVSGGENVYPEEIEGALERHPAVAAAGVVPVSHERWGQVPKAVVVPEGTDEPTPEALETHLRERLAGFKVPQAWAVAEELPRSGPGKLDRGALAENYGERESAAESDDGANSRPDRSAEQAGNGSKAKSGNDGPADKGGSDGPADNGGSDGPADNGGDEK